MAKMIENIQKGMLIGIMTLGIMISIPHAASADIPVHTQLYRTHPWEDMVLKKKKDQALEIERQLKQNESNKDMPKMQYATLPEGSFMRVEEGFVQYYVPIKTLNDSQKFQVESDMITQSENKKLAIANRNPIDNLLAGVGIVTIFALAEPIGKWSKGETSKAEQEYLEINNGTRLDIKCKFCGTPMVPDTSACINCLQQQEFPLV